MVWEEETYCQHSSCITELYLIAKSIIAENNAPTTILFEAQKQNSFSAIASDEHLDYVTDLIELYLQQSLFHYQ